MMDNITSHKVNGLNDALEIRIFDEPGDGGACHEYQIESVEKTADYVKMEQLARANCRIHFQNGPIAEKGVNGISNESLLAIVEHRLQGFQSGEFACDENNLALSCVGNAIDYLHHRTRMRLSRGVEGTHEK